MNATKTDIDWTDLFCGRGGSTTGISQVPGMSVAVAANHWQLAVDNHAANHQDTDHICADISQRDPKYFPHTVAAWGSPECTNHTVAKGKKRVTNQPDLFGDTLPDEAAERSRATMWDVCRLSEFHNYQIFITENVVEAARWVMFDAWLMAMTALGYNHHIVYMNAMHAQLGGLPAPQSRDRMYVVFWKKGNRAPDFDRLRPNAYCPSCGEVVRAMQVFKKPERWGKYKAQYNWRCPKQSCKNRIIEPAWLPASTAIDWTLRGQRIGDRPLRKFTDKKTNTETWAPLAPKTLARIHNGLEMYGSTPMSIDSVRGSQIISAVDREPFATQTTAYTRSLLIPVEGRDGKTAQPVTNAMRTQTTRNETGILTPGHSMLMEYYGNGTMHELTKAIPTITTHDRFAMITTLRGHNTPKLVSDVLDTFAANGLHHGLTEWDAAELDDCEFRMLEPHEISRGMAFPENETEIGTKRERVKMSGNAVCPPCARDLAIITGESLMMS